MTRSSIIEKYYFVLMVLSIVILFVQYFYSTSFSLSTFRLKKQEQITEQERIISELLKENLILKNQLYSQSRYSDIYNKINGTIEIKSFLNVVGYILNANNKLLSVKTSNKVARNDLVINTDKILIGRVIRTTKTGFATVQLIEDQNSNIPVFTSSGSYGIVHGATGLQQHICDLLFSNKFSTLRPYEGDLVYTSGQSNLVRNKILVGKIFYKNNLACVLHVNPAMENDPKLVVVDNEF